MNGESKDHIKLSDTYKGFDDYMKRKRLRKDTRTTYLRHIRTFEKAIGKKADNMTREDIKVFERYCTRYDDNSLIGMYGAVNKYIAYLFDKSVIDKDKAESLKLSAPKVKQKLRKAMAREQVEKVFRIAKENNPRDYAIFLVLYDGMLRRKELMQLTLDDIDFKRKRIKIIDSKNGDSCEVRVTTRCIDALIDYIKNHREEPKTKSDSEILFLNRGRKLSKNKIFEIHRQYKYRCEFPESMDFFPHIWRHTGITHYAQVQKDAKLLQLQSRHKSMDILYDRYIHKSEKEIDDSYDKAFEREIPEEDKPKPKPHRQKPQDNYIADSKDEMLLQMKEEIQKLKAQLDNQNRGYV